MPELRREDWQTLTGPWTQLLERARPAAGPFASPYFQSAWWEVFHNGLELDLQAVWDDSDLVGVLPLQRTDATVQFVGDHEVCDYMDLIAAPGREEDVVAALMDHLDASDIQRADLRGLAEGSTTLEHLPHIARSRGWKVVEEQEAICPVVSLVGDWETYLSGLKKRHRHEIRRKLRNLSDGGAVVALEVVEEPTQLREKMPLFLRFMAESRGDKAQFLTDQMGVFFQLLVERLAPTRLVRLYLLSVDSEWSAAVLGFISDRSVLLYNSGYDPAYGDLSVGIASKVFLIRDAIEGGLSQVNFLRGEEEYKFQLGAEPSPVTRLILSH